MLYPFWIRVWTGAAGLVGMGAQDWDEFIRLCQAMNAFCAAAAIGLLFSILQKIAGTRFALLGAFQFGFAEALVLHATNSAEPVTGLMFSMAALRILAAALGTERHALLVPVGFLLVLATASYETMALTVVVVVCGCFCWPGTQIATALKRILIVGVSGLVSLVVVYGRAYASLGIRPAKMLAQLFVVADDQYYGGLRAAKFVNFPFGLLENLFQAVPRGYQGVRWLRGAPHAAAWLGLELVCLTMLTVLGWQIMLGVAAAARRSALPRRMVGLVAGASLLAVCFPLVYRDPMYDKMWLLPLAALTIAATVAFRFSSSGARRLLFAGFAVLLIAEVARNVPRAVQDHLQVMPQLAEARRLASVVNRRDAVIRDFDGVSELWAAIWGDGVNILNLPSSTRQETAEWLALAETKETAEHGAIYFVTVLDYDRARWDAFLGHIMKVPYSALDCYRDSSVIVQRFSVGGTAHTVRRLDRPSFCAPLLAVSHRSQ